MVGKKSSVKILQRFLLALHKTDSTDSTSSDSNSGSSNSNSSDSSSSSSSRCNNSRTGTNTISPCVTSTTTLIQGTTTRWCVAWSYYTISELQTLPPTPVVVPIPIHMHKPNTVDMDRYGDTNTNTNGATNSNTNVNTNTNGNAEAMESGVMDVEMMRVCDVSSCIVVV